MTVKRLRKPKLKDGELRVYWGKVPHENPDVVFAWQGDRMMKRDTNLLCSVFCSKQPDPFVQPIFSRMMPSLIEELTARGYDLTTLRFSISKKVASHE